MRPTTKPWNELVRAITRSGYITKDDDLSSSIRIVDMAVYVIERLREDRDEARDQLLEVKEQINAARITEDHP